MWVLDAKIIISTTLLVEERDPYESLLGADSHKSERANNSIFDSILDFQSSKVSKLHFRNICA